VLLQSKLVVKPDMLFGQRGKHDLVGLNLTYDEAEAFVKARMGKQVSPGQHQQHGQANRIQHRVAQDPA